MFTKDLLINKNNLVRNYIINYDDLFDKHIQSLNNLNNQRNAIISIRIWTEIKLVKCKMIDNSI